MKKLVGLLLFAFLIGCSSNSDPNPETQDPTTLFTITTAAGSEPLRWTGAWFVAWDDDGTLLDFKKAAEGQKLVLTTKEEITNNKLTLGYFRYNGAGDSKNTYASIFTDYAPGTEINFEADAKFPDVPGSYSLTVNNEPANSQITISSKYGPDSNFGLGGQKSYTCDWLKDTHEYIVTYNGHPNLYQELNDVDAGDSFELDFDDFKPFEKSTTINLPPDYSNFYIMYTGYEEGQPSTDFGYVLDNSYNMSETPSTYTLGYMASLRKFNTTIALTYDDASVAYVKYGDHPGTINWPDPGKYSVSSFDLKTLSVSVQEPVENIVAMWLTSDRGVYTALYVYSPKLAPKIGEIPAELLTANPNFEFKTTSETQRQVDFIVKGSIPYEKTRSMFFSRKAEEYVRQTVTVSDR